MEVLKIFTCSITVETKQEKIFIRITETTIKDHVNTHFVQAKASKA